MKWRSIVVLIILAYSVNAYSSDKLRIAVIDLKANKVSEVIASAISNMIRSDLVDTGLFVVVERNQMKEIMKEQALQMTGCTDSACAVQVGKLLSARKILVGDVTRMGNGMLITVRMVDVEKGVSEFSSREKSPSEDKLDETASKLTLKLVRRMTGKQDSELATKLLSGNTGYYMRSIVPGWGQLYRGHTVKGYAFIGSFAMAGAFLGYSIMNYNSASADYSDMKTGSESDFKAKHDETVSAASMVNISLGILALVYTVHWVDVLLFSKTAPVTAAHTPGLQGPGGSCFSFTVNHSSAELNEKYYNAAIIRRF